MITPSFGLTATERVLPELALDFTTATLDPRITFTRSGNTATVVNSSGVIVAVNADLPRFDYNPVTLACKGLLIEEARTNLLTYSSDYSNAIWGVKSGISLSSGVTAPDGGTSTLVENTSNGTRRIEQIATVTASTAYTATVYMKKGTTNFGAMSFVDSPDQGFWTFNLDTGVVGNNIVSSKTSTAAITDAGGGWYRCSITATTASTFITIRILPVTSVSVGTGAVGDNINVFGAQLEAGAFATSYIPTTTAALTRNADVAVMTGTNFSDWFNASEGTLQAYYTNQAASTSPFSISDGTLNNRIQLTGRAVGASGTCAWIASGGVGQLTLSNVSFAETNTTSLAYKSNSCAAAQNASSPSTDNSASIPVVNSAALGNIVGSSIMCGHLKKVSYFPVRLTNAEIQAISK